MTSESYMLKRIKIWYLWDSGGSNGWGNGEEWAWWCGKNAGFSHFWLACWISVGGMCLTISCVGFGCRWLMQDAQDAVKLKLAWGISSKLGMEIAIRFLCFSILPPYLFSDIYIMIFFSYCAYPLILIITFWFLFYGSSWSVLPVAIPGMHQGMRYQLWL